MARGRGKRERRTAGHRESAKGTSPALQEGATRHNVSDAGGRWGGGWRGEDPPRPGETLWRVALHLSRAMKQ